MRSDVEFPERDDMEVTEVATGNREARLEELLAAGWTTVLFADFSPSPISRSTSSSTLVAAQLGNDKQPLYKSLTNFADNDGSPRTSQPGTPRKERDG
jgi:hypothetical protein